MLETRPGPHAALIERVCSEEPFSSSGYYGQILRHLDDNHGDDSKRTLKALCDAIPDETDSLDRNAEMKTAISRLRHELSTFFIRHPNELLMLDIPEAHGRVYCLQAVRRVSGLSGAEEFWYPHFENGVPNMIVFNEPLFFRVFGRKYRFFIRDLDLNDSEDFSGDKEQIAELKRRFPWLKQSDVTVSRGYIPGGEVFAKDLVRDWLQEHSRDFLQRKKGRGKVKQVFEQILSGSRPWSQGPEADAPCLGDSNLIVLGNSRSTSEVRFLQASDESKVHRYRIEDKGIVIENPTSTERAILKSKGRHSERHGDSCIILEEDWRKESLALLTRGRSLESPKITTSIVANQGRGIHAVASVLTNDDKWHSLARELHLPPRLPAEFQVLFHVTLFPESRPTKCTLLLKSHQLHARAAA